MYLTEANKNVTVLKEKINEFQTISNRMAIDPESKTVDYIRFQTLLKEAEQQLLEIQSNCDHAIYAKEWAEVSSNPNDWRNSQSVNGTCLICGKSKIFVPNDEAIIISNGYRGVILTDYFDYAKQLLMYLIENGKSDNKAFAYTEEILLRLKDKVLCHEELIEASQPIIKEFDEWRQQRHMENEIRRAEIMEEINRWPDWKKEGLNYQAPVKIIGRSERSKFTGMLEK